MSFFSHIATLLPRSFEDGVVYLNVNEFKEIYKAYLQKLHLFMKRYCVISLAFCTEIYAGEQYQSFPTEWEKDMTLLCSTPSLFLGIIELQDLTLFQLKEMEQINSGISASLLEFLQLARDLSLSRAHFNPLTADQCNFIVKYIKNISKYNALLFNCAQKKALEVFFLSIVVDIFTNQEGLIRKVQAEQNGSINNDEIQSAQKYILDKIAFYQEIKDKLTALCAGCFMPRANSELIELDFGAGRGYYSVYKAIEAGRSLIAIEGSLKHVEGLCRYITGVKASKRAQSSKLTDTFEPLRSLRVALLYVDDSTSGKNIETVSIPIRDLSDRIHGVKTNTHVRGSVIQGAQLPCLSSSTDHEHALIASCSECTNKDDKKDHQYSAVGLHACGPLSVVALKMLMQKDVNYVFTVPCCYGHLTKDTFPLSAQGYVLINDFFSAAKIKAMFRGYHADTVPREFLTYAASDCVFTWSEVSETIQSYWARATIELARRQQSPTPIKRPLDKELKALLCEDNASLFRAIVTDLRREAQLKELDCPSSSSSKSYPINIDQQKIAHNAIEQAASYKWVMQAHYLVRKVSGHVFETFILMDRLAGLIELAERSSIQLCAGILPVLTELSPRGFLVYGFKC